jgi:hypothetical protein
LNKLTVLIVSFKLSATLSTQLTDIVCKQLPGDRVGACFRLSIITGISANVDSTFMMTENSHHN